jgi:tight adherence protein B
MQLVASECRPPISAEFRHCCEQQNLGLSYESALRGLASRIPLVELHILVISLLVQRQCGGNPVEVMGNMADLVRKRLRLDQRLKALTGEGRMQAWVLTILPVSAFFGLWVMRPEYMQPLLERPVLLASAAAAQILGSVWIRWLLRLPF